MKIWSLEVPINAQQSTDCLSIWLENLFPTDMKGWQTHNDEAKNYG